MKAFKLTENQAEAILNMRLRSLRKLEEMEIRGEHGKLSKERDQLQALLKSDAKQWKEIGRQIGELKEMFGPKTALGRRRSEIGKAPAPMDVEALTEALTEKEPVTVVCSAKDWIRAFKGHGQNTNDIKYKEGDREKFIIETMTNDKLIMFATNGRFYTIGCDKLPPGRGFGEPLRLMVEMAEADVISLQVYNPDAKLLVVSEDGKGFIVTQKDVLAQTRQGKQVLNVGEGEEAKLCVPVPDNADHVAVMGTNRKMLVFKLAEIPEMTKGKGVMLQKYSGGKIADVKAFNLKEGLFFRSRGTPTKVGDVRGWMGGRASAGKMPPNGFPTNNKFD
jgi:topoisomerase-4 subunit A